MISVTGNITGIARQYETLGLDATLEGWGEVPPKSYQWERDSSPISGATASTYTLSQMDVGKTITVDIMYEIYIPGSLFMPAQYLNIWWTSSPTLNVENVNDAPTSLSISTSTFDENISGGSVVSTLISSDIDDNDSHTYTLVAGVGATDNSLFTIDGDQLIIVDSPDFETKSSYSIRLQTTDSGGLTYEESFTLTVNDLEEGPSDLDGDGFVDGIINYQMWTESGGVDLTNRRGKTFSDNTSRLWDLTKAVEVDSGFMILLEGDRSKEGKYRVVNARETGVISGATPWVTGRKLAKFGYEEIFDMDFNGNDVVDVV